MIKHSTGRHPCVFILCIAKCCRERRRQELSEAEDKTKELTAQLEQLKKAENDANNLEQQNFALRQQIEQKQAEVSKARSSTQARSSDSDSTSGLQAQHPGQANLVPRRAPTKKSELDAIVQKWLATVSCSWGFPLCQSRDLCFC